MNSDFSVDFFSDSRYEELTAEISYKGQILCQLNKDRGVNFIEVEFFTDSRIFPEAIEMKFCIDDFLEVLLKTQKDLAGQAT
jgi:hypothetical protein